MAFVITQPCIDVRDQSCVEVCPVDCIQYEDGPDRMLYIDPTTCIDCGACEPACPVTAIFAEADVPADQSQFVAINSQWYEDKAAARALVKDIPALEGAAEAAAAAASVTETAAPAETTAAAPAPAAAASAPAAPAPEAEPEAVSMGAFKMGEAGVEGKCAVCGQYVIKGGTAFRHKSVLCPDHADYAERIRNPYRQVAGRR